MYERQNRLSYNTYWGNLLMATQRNFESYISPEDYLILDNASKTKYEYLDGQIYAMSGGTPKHSKIIYNLTGLMFRDIGNKQCGGFNSDIRVQVSKNEYLYPDFTVVCGEARFDEDSPNNLLNPTMVAEVVSDSSEVRDHFIKLNIYQKIESLKIYCIIEQNKPKITLHTRQDNGWLKREFEGLDVIVPLDAINAQLVLSELYETIAFDDVS